MDKTFNPTDARPAAAVAGWELQNMLTVCFLITTAAIQPHRVARRTLPPRLPDDG